MRSPVANEGVKAERSWHSWKALNCPAAKRHLQKQGILFSHPRQIWPSVWVCVCVCVCACVRVCQMLFREGLQRKHISGNYDCRWRSPSMLLAALMERGRTRSPTPVTHCALRILARSVICTMFAYDSVCVCVCVCVCVREREVGEHREHLNGVFIKGHN